MYDNIEKDFKKFKKYHKNRYNVIVHILCFVLAFTAFLFLFKNDKIKLFLTIFYLIFIKITFNNLIILFQIVFLLFSSFILFCCLKINSVEKIFFIFIITYIIAELSHVVFNEKTYLYERLDQEKGLFNKVSQLIVHTISILPYCLLIIRELQ